MIDYMHEIIALIDLSQNKPLNEIVYEGLRKALIMGIIPVGAHVNEKVYSHYLNVSRTPVRKAIEKLKEEQLIEHIPNFGVVVKRVTIEDAIEIYKIRIALETLATITAIDEMTKEDYVEMEALLSLTEELNEKHEVEKVIRYFSDFNAMIFRFARMPRLEIVIARLQEYLARFRHISLYDDARRKRALEEHRIIFQGIKAKDKALIELIVADHLNYSKNFVVEEIIRAENQKLNQ